MTTETVVSPRDRLVTLTEGLSEDKIELLLPFLADLIERAETEEGLEQLDRDGFREHLDLPRRLPEPTITSLSGVELPDSGVGWDDRMTLGQYDWANSNITQPRFPISLPGGPRDLVLAHFGVNVESDDVVAWAVANGYEASPIDDLFAVGSHSEHKELQRQFPIVALGSSAVVSGGRDVPSLDRDGSERGLYLRCWDGGWGGDYRFLLVRKASS